MINGEHYNSIKVVSNSDGEYVFKNLSVGIYTLETEVSGFKKFKAINLEVKAGEELSFNIELQPSETTITVGIYASEPLIDVNSSSVTTTITREMIDKLPR